MIRLLLPTEAPPDRSAGKSAGYSRVPLVHKLGIKSGWRVCFLNAPHGYHQQLGELPEGVVVLPEGSTEAVEFVQVFADRHAGLEQTLQTQRERIVPHGMIWVSWPKKSSGVRTDLDENRIRDLALRLQLVDVKVAAIDQTWSGLKLVIRIKDRQG
ncbi:MAG: DUF3052 domain-containing protein [Anaerolineales bacterium]|jgi:hypothetical protein